MSRPILICKSAIPGSWVAVALSYAINKSILWCIFHALCGWLYVVYWLFQYTEFRDWLLQWVIY